MAESISEGTLKTWLKQPGDTVQADEEVATIETDKVRFPASMHTNYAHRPLRTPAIILCCDLRPQNAIPCNDLARSLRLWDHLFGETRAFNSRVTRRLGEHSICARLFRVHLTRLCSEMLMKYGITLDRLCCSNVSAVRHEASLLSVVANSGTRSFSFTVCAR